jgi:hypothetical protein
MRRTRLAGIWIAGFINHVCGSAQRQKGERMRLFTRAVIVLALLMGTAACAMANEVWTFNNVEFNNGGTFDPNQLSGTFTTNTVGSTWSVVNFSLTITPIVTAGDTPDPNNVFTVFQVLGSPTLPNEISLSNVGFSEFIDLIPSAPLSPTGGTFALTSGFDCAGCGTLITNLDPTVTGTAPGVGAPEPSSALFLVCGLGGLAFFSRKRLGLA